ncbi:MAG: PaREP1 family protein [Desulfurococcales archaeon]|nr:PaREP1 family protein [Desulfurococcales archaeon]
MKTIAIALKPPEADEAAKRGRWTTDLLESAVVSIMKKPGVSELYHWWDSTYKLHVDGFLEARLGSDDVRLRLRDVEALVDLAKKVLKA